jgi:hypothetical protein
MVLRGHYRHFALLAALGAGTLPQFAAQTHAGEASSAQIAATSETEQVTITGSRLGVPSLTAQTAQDVRIYDRVRIERAANPASRISSPRFPRFR